MNGLPEPPWKQPVLPQYVVYAAVVLGFMVFGLALIWILLDPSA